MRVMLTGMLLAMALGCAGQALAVDYYTLSVTLPPAFCALHPNKAGSRECQQLQPVGMHGLWPESFAGRPPEDCGGGSPELSYGLVRRLAPVMPDAGLRRHEWQTHGSCTGLSPEDYFTLLLNSFNKLQWPAFITGTRGRDRVVERRLLLDSIRQANPGLPERGLYLRCEGRDRPPYLSEIRICLAADGRFTDCGRSFKPNCPVAVNIKAQ